MSDMQQAGMPQQPAQRSNNTCLIIGIILIVVFVVLPICIGLIAVVVLALLGPSIGNIFSNITIGL